jgi:multiple sugar transport system permease protein
MARKTDEFLARERERASRPALFRGALELAVSAALLAALAAFVAWRGPRPGRLGLRQERAAFALLVPWAIGFAAFFLGPAVVTAVLSLSEWSPLRELDDARWAGLDNFARLADDPTFHASLTATFSYALLSVPLGLILALAIALLLREDGAWSGITRTLVYVPAIVSPVIVGAVWHYLLDPERGLLNEGLAAVGLPAIPWTRDPNWVIPSFVLMSVWSVGGQMLVFLAALKALDPSLEEAARIDGAGPLRRLWHVTLPQLSPVLLFNLLIGVLNAFQVFAQPYVVTQGGPGDASRFLVLYLYESGFRHLDMGYAAALSAVLFALLGALSWGIWRASARWVHYAARSGT